MSQDDQKQAKAGTGKKGTAKPKTGKTKADESKKGESRQPSSATPPASAAGRTASGRSARTTASAAAPVKAPSTTRPHVPRARRMQLSLTRLEPWSVAKVTFLLSIAGAIIQVVAAALLWILLNAMGLFDNLTQVISKTGLDAGGFDLGQVLSLGTVLSSVTIFSIFEIVIVVALVTIFAFLYNLVSSLVGGIHVTLGDD
ncbi:DUF3566 domain-containing protein [Bifidobacterium sp. B4107]|uniref:DUF3566 domain-containing protein n=1 Tax=unclassified Bifidobacterium TaxID=2608897 RepID=UPI00226B999E|nr:MULTISPECIES: DUF3566 domain-containing protein [unclassified Bifidobacterium]MCX8647974.1 DUF3566 domain-containing protein [Bifidobacterium sp. B4107]MCX8652154.1 DUF3566 domain-containing protein [Bifidobacterium sp. B4111]MCX8658210.1 DUF3566 domain-containing protein [Bifidobacterium sp. B4114]